MERELKGLNEFVRVATTAQGIEGEVALALDPGTRADAQRKALDAVLAGPLTEAATQLDLVLAARPSSFAFGEPGKDSEGRSRFYVRGRREGDRLVPSPTETQPAKARAKR